MAASSGEDETSVGTLSPVVPARQDPGQDPASASVSMPAAEHAPVGSKPAARMDRVFPEKSGWNQYKPLMRKLYIDEKKTLAEVKEHMRAQHDFDASWVHPQTQADALRAGFTNKAAGPRCSRRAL